MSFLIRLLKASFLYGLKYFKPLFQFPIIVFFIGIPIFLLLVVNWKAYDFTFIIFAYLFVVSLRLLFNKNFGILKNENVKLVFEAVLMIAFAILFFVIGFDIIPSKDESGMFGSFLLYLFKVVLGLFITVIGIGLGYNGYRYIILGDKE